MCDASDYAVGAVLGQKIDKKLNVIYYASKTMDDAQCNELHGVWRSPSSFDAYKRKKFFKDARHYYWDEPYLYKRGPDSIYRRCIAEEDVQGVLEHCHGSAYGGHFATFKTATKVCNLVMVAYLVQGCSKFMPSVIHAKGKEGSPRG
ncbi:unnamed protein product [Microthlaspi erraticum]|uniref:Reverse transcriptase/retrotransposon-derived protein RNase H-like domain-containing protein n=1 Tax=Microthlaspi erraticum TaxID=1685480 RepID=A0A6D2JGE8_9BRAS|nr:unnamed protein product [Microthlaspi erraticum]